MKKILIMFLVVFSIMFCDTSFAIPPSKGTDGDPAQDKGKHYGTDWNKGKHYGWGENTNDDNENYHRHHRKQYQRVNVDVDNKNVNNNTNKNVNNNTNKNVNNNTNKNVNNNTNKNVNNNVNTSLSESSSTSDSDLTIEGSFNYTGKREFATPGQHIFPNTPGYFGSENPGHEFIPLGNILMYDTVWSVESAENMLRSKQNGKDIQIRDLFAFDNVVKTTKVVCVIKRIEGNIVQLSIGSIAATNKKSISADVFAKVIVEASKRGATHIHFLSEGVNKSIESSGFGIGMTHTTAVISDSEQTGNVSSGGFGYTKGSARYINKPWLQFVFLKKK